MEEIDLMLDAKWVIPICPEDQVLEDHSIAINQGRILSVLPTQKATRQFKAQTQAKLDHHVVMPGLVNAHTHAAMSLFRGIADDMSLQPWLTKHIWPLEGQWVNEDFVHVGTQLASAEMILSGTLCVNDMYLYAQTSAESFLKSGLRAMIGLIALDFPTSWASGFAECMRKNLVLYDEYKKNQLLSFCFAPHSTYALSDQSLRKLNALATELDLPTHMHVHENRAEVEESIKQHGESPLHRLKSLDMLGPNLLAVHMTQLSNTEIDWIAQANVHVITCPRSNAKLASGVCPVFSLMQKGINIAIGTDGPASNNNLNMIEEMRHCAMMSKIQSSRADAMKVHDTLYAATLGGAKALGLEDEIGSITQGKSADLIAINLQAPNSLPVHDAASQIVYAASSSQVSDAWVQGKQLLKNRELMTIDIDYLNHEVARWTRIINHAP